MKSHKNAQHYQIPQGKGLITGGAFQNVTPGFAFKRYGVRTVQLAEVVLCVIVLFPRFEGFSALVTEKGHEEYTVTKKGHDEYTVTEKGHGEYIVTKKGHDEYIVTKKGHGEYIVTKKGHDEYFIEGKLLGAIKLYNIRSRVH